MTRHINWPTLCASVFLSLATIFSYATYVSSHNDQKLIKKSTEVTPPKVLKWKVLKKGKKQIKGTNGRTTTAPNPIQ